MPSPKKVKAQLIFKHSKHKPYGYAQKKHKGTALAEDRLYFFLVQETMPKNTGVF